MQTDQYTRSALGTDALRQELEAHPDVPEMLVRRHYTLEAGLLHHDHRGEIGESGSP